MTSSRDGGSVASKPTRGTAHSASSSTRSLSAVPTLSGAIFLAECDTSSRARDRLGRLLALWRSPAMRALASSLVAAAVVSLTGKLGDAFAPLLLSRGWTVLLLALNANDCVCVLTASELGLVMWLSIITLRRVAEDGFYFAVGRRHGVSASSALGFDLRSAGQRWRNTSLAVLLLFPSAPVCLLIGASETPALLFALADVLSTVLRALLLRMASASPLQIALAPIRSIITTHTHAALATTAAMAAPGLIGACAIGWRALRPSSANSAPPGTSR